MRREVVYGFIDQALISAMHFSIGFFFIKKAPKEDYGLYSIAFASILFLIGLSNAVITTQMTVNAVDRPEGQRDLYCHEMLLAQTIILIPIIILVFLIVWSCKSFGLVGLESAQFIVVVAAAGSGAIFHEFFRRLYFLRLKPHLVLLIDFARLLLLIVMTFIFLKSDIYPNFHTMMVAGYGLSAVLSGYIGYKIACLPIKSTLRGATESLLEAWLNGKWATAGVSVTWLQNQSYTYLLAAFSGTSAIADANASRLFFAPIAMLTTSFARIFMPRLSIMRSKGEINTIAKQSRKIIIVIMAIVTGYAFVVLTCKDIVLNSFFPAKYQNITPLIIAWMLYFLFQGVRTNASLILQVFKKFKYLTISSAVINATITLLCVVLIHYFGVIGNIAGMALGELILSIVLWRMFDRFLAA